MASIWGRQTLPPMASHMDGACRALAGVHRCGALARAHHSSTEPSLGCGFSPVRCRRWRAHVQSPRWAALSTEPSPGCGSLCRALAGVRMCRTLAGLHFPEGPPQAVVSIDPSRSLPYPHLFQNKINLTPLLHHSQPTTSSAATAPHTQRPHPRPRPNPHSSSATTPAGTNNGS